MITLQSVITSLKSSLTFFTHRIFKTYQPILIKKKAWLFGGFGHGLGFGGLHGGLGMGGYGWG
jgi:hypothetical protein